MQGAVELRAAVTVELRAAAAGAAVGMEEAAEAARVDALEAMEEVMEAEQVATAEAEVDMGAMQEGVTVKSWRRRQWR